LLNQNSESFDGWVGDTEGGALGGVGKKSLGSISKASSLFLINFPPLASGGDLHK
jgi:hypothetical protein